MAIASPTPTSTIAVSAALPTICIIVVVLRLVARRVSKARVVTEDWLVMVALVSSTLFWFEPELIVSDNSVPHNRNGSSINHR
jgi:hypothetical protein